MIVNGASRFVSGITGDLVGNVIGNLTGNVDGNASSATKAINDGNGNVITATYLPLSGGTLSGNNNVLNINSSTENSWIYFKTDYANKASAGYYNGLAFIANETANYARIGINDNGVPQY